LTTAQLSLDTLKPECCKHAKADKSFLGTWLCEVSDYSFAFQCTQENAGDCPFLEDKISKSHLVKNMKKNPKETQTISTQKTERLNKKEAIEL